MSRSPSGRRERLREDHERLADELPFHALDDPQRRARLVDTHGELVSDRALPRDAFDVLKLSWYERTPEPLSPVTVWTRARTTTSAALGTGTEPEVVLRTLVVLELEANGVRLDRVVERIGRVAAVGRKRRGRRATGGRRGATPDGDACDRDRDQRRQGPSERERESGRPAASEGQTSEGTALPEGMLGRQQTTPGSGGPCRGLSASRAGLARGRYRHKTCVTRRLQLHRTQGILLGDADRRQRRRRDSPLSFRSQRRSARGRGCVVDAPTVTTLGADARRVQVGHHAPRCRSPLQQAGRGLRSGLRPAPSPTRNPAFSSRRSKPIATTRRPRSSGATPVRDPHRLRLDRDQGRVHVRQQRGDRRLSSAQGEEALLLLHGGGAQRAALEDLRRDSALGRGPARQDVHGSGQSRAGDPRRRRARAAVKTPRVGSIT